MRVGWQRRSLHNSEEVETQKWKQRSRVWFAHEEEFAHERNHARARESNRICICKECRSGRETSLVSLFKVLVFFSFLLFTTQKGLYVLAQIYGHKARRARRPAAV